jgi:hypothetical protein
MKDVLILQSKKRLLVGTSCRNSRATMESTPTRETEELRDEQDRTNHLTEDSDRRDDDSADEMEEFRPLRCRITLETLVPLALRVRDVGPEVTCEISPDPLFGSYNILYRLDFSDTVRWLVKLPVRAGDPGPWTEDDAFMIRSEVCTLRAVKERTAIPVPAVYAHDATFNNEICCPFILMEFLPGTPANRFWKQEHPPSKEGQDKRDRFLRSYAQCVSQLGRLSYNCDGYLDYDSATVQDTIYRMPSEDSPAGTLASVGLEQYCRNLTIGTMLSDLDADPDNLENGCIQLLSLLAKQLPVLYSTISDKPFVLMHADPDLQNVLVDNNGMVTGIIDWEGADVTHRVGGNLAYPPWLIRDFHPCIYWYSPEAGNPSKEDSPEELDRCRAVWRDAVGELFEDPVAKEKASRLARNSLFASTLSSACHDRGARFAIGARLVTAMMEPEDLREWLEDGDEDEAVLPEPGSNPDMNLGLNLKVVTRLMEDSLTPRLRELLKERFVRHCS